jgi:hypothetical protein
MLVQGGAQMPVLALNLAQELFAAGFPQEISKAEYFYDEEGKRLVRYPYLPFPRVGAYRSPGLGALVEACALDLQSLIRDLEGWRANDALGATPEEAVARLWLQLRASGARPDAPPLQGPSEAMQETSGSAAREPLKDNDLPPVRAAVASLHKALR